MILIIIVFRQKPKNKVKVNLFYKCQILIIIFGVFTFVIQFVNINFFNIKIKEQLDIKKYKFYYLN